MLGPREQGVLGRAIGRCQARFLATLLHGIARQGLSLDIAYAHARDALQSRSGAGECLTAIDTAYHLARSGGPDAHCVHKLGPGHTALGALTGAVYFAFGALYKQQLWVSLQNAVAASGDDHSTTTVVGALLGAMYGIDAIPAGWRDGLEPGVEIETLATDLYWIDSMPNVPVDRLFGRRYPRLVGQHAD